MESEASIPIAISTYAGHFRRPGLVRPTGS